MARNGCGYPGHKVVTGSMNGWTELIFHADANSGDFLRSNLKNYFKKSWVVVVKNGHWTLISMNGWM